MKHSGFVVNCAMKSEWKRLIIFRLAFELGEPNRILLNVITHTYPTSFFFFFFHWLLPFPSLSLTLLVLSLVNSRYRFELYLQCPVLHTFIIPWLRPLSFTKHNFYPAVRFHKSKMLQVYRKNKKRQVEQATDELFGRYIFPLFCISHKRSSWINPLPSVFPSDLVER